MALIIFLRGLNVGGYRSFRPSLLARELSTYDVVNVGAAGTFIVRKPGSRPAFLAELRRKLPFETVVACCTGADLLEFALANLFGSEPLEDDVVQFVSILSDASQKTVSLPMTLPAHGEWFVRILGSKDRFVFGIYRRRMKTIAYLGQIDKVFGARATTRSWSTMLSVLRILKPPAIGANQNPVRN